MYVVCSPLCSGCCLMWFMVVWYVLFVGVGGLLVESLFVVCCLWFVVCRPWIVGVCACFSLVLLNVRCLLLVGGCLLARCSLFVVVCWCRLPFMVRCALLCVR